MFDTVGGVLFRSAAEGLSLRGRLIEIAAAGMRELSFDPVDFYASEGRIFGLDTLKYDPRASAQALDALGPGFEAGDGHALGNPRRLRCRVHRAPP